MILIGTLLLIPIFFIGLIMYFMTLINFVVSGKLNIVFVLTGLLVIFITSFILPKLLIKLMPNYLISYKYDNKESIYYSYFCFILLFFFGIANLVTSIIYQKMYIEFLFGIFSIVLVIYVTFNYIFNYKEKVLKLESIVEIEKNVLILNFYTEDDECIEYFTKKSIYEENSFYLVKYNKYTNDIKKIMKKVINVE